MKALAMLRFTLLLVLLLGATSLLRADDAPPPTRAARLTYVKGTVTVTQPGEAESLSAQVNLPLLSGVLLTTAGDGQAEVEFEDGSVVRLTPNSALALESLMLDADGIATSRLRLEHGVAFVELRATNLYRYSFSAGDDSLSPLENSTVRVDLDTPPPTFSVLSGSIRVDGPEGLRADVNTGENLRPDDVDAGQYHRNQGIIEDSWNQWNDDMDQDAAAEAASTTDVRGNYAGQQGYGWSDLDANGTWYDAGSGPVWQPNGGDDASFDPYSNGSWVAYSSIGYVWASAYPWGWTPYRCGNWSYYSSFGWGWAPGSSCGTMGWRFQGGGRPVNIASAPQSYRPIRVPSPGHGVQRPIHVEPSHSILAGTPPRDDHRGARQIAGVTATPIAPQHQVWRNSTATSALRRDFPVDARNHQPLVGAETTHRATFRTWPAQNQAPATAVEPAANNIDTSGRVNQPVYTAQPRPTNPQPASAEQPAAADRQIYRDQHRNMNNAPSTRVQTIYGSGSGAAQQPTYTPAPSVITGGGTHQTYAPSAAPTTQTHPTYTPPPSTVTGGQMHPAYTPPPQPQSHPAYTPRPEPQSHPAYTPPPQPQSHPTYSPPPQPAPQFHPTYSPPQSAPAPRSSSPAPSSNK